MEMIIRYIYNDLLELSSITLQRKLWLNDNNDTGLISSYIELMNRLFDDNDFDNFIDNTAEKSGFSLDIILELKKLRDLLNAYNDDKTDDEIVKDLEWIRITNQAETVVQLWDSELPIK